MIRLYSKIPNEPTSSPKTKAEKYKEDIKNAVERKNLRMKEVIRAKHMDFENALERKNLRMKEVIRAKHMDFENALERKNLRMKEAIWVKHMDFENAIERKNLRMKEAIRAKHMDFENALRFIRQMFERSRPLIYQRSDYLPTELDKLLWSGGVKYEEMSAMRQSLIQVAGRMLGKITLIYAQAVFAHLDMDKEFDIVDDLWDFIHVIALMLKEFDMLV
ncbi:hypothetical protein Tco_1330298 [Tanacetum coccineum]